MFSTERTKRPSQITAASRRSPPSQVAEKIANNDDLLTNILLNLPIKSLITFKSVSKRWLSLISDPHFSLLFHRHNPFSDHISGLFLAVRSRPFHIHEFDFVNLDPTASKSSKAPFKTLAFADKQLGIGIVQSCNGLLLCFSNIPLEPAEFFVYNPTTKQFAKLPPISKQVLGLGLAFDPSKSPHYTVVCVRHCEVTENGYQVDVYSSEAREWRLSGGSFHMGISGIWFRGGVFLNGSVHWISAVEESSFYFNVDQERISPFPLPPIPDGREFIDRHFNYFGECRGHLHLIDHVYDPQAPQFDVYEMEPDYSHWTVKFRVDLSQVPSAFPQILRTNTRHYLNSRDYEFTVLCVVRGEVEESSYLVLQIPGKVLRQSQPLIQNSRIRSDGQLWKNPKDVEPYFNVAEERIGQMPMPAVPDHPLEEVHGRFGYFGESRDHLHLVDHRAELGESQFHVWELEGDYSKWVVKYRVDVSEISKAFPEMIPSFDFWLLAMKDYHLSVICVVRCEVGEESYLVMNVPGKILRYNFANGSFSKVCDFALFQCVMQDEITEMYLKSFEAYQYIESLACV